MTDKLLAIQINRRNKDEVEKEAPWMTGEHFKRSKNRFLIKSTNPDVPQVTVSRAELFRKYYCVADNPFVGWVEVSLINQGLKEESTLRAIKVTTDNIPKILSFSDASIKFLQSSLGQFYIIDTSKNDEKLYSVGTFYDYYEVLSGDVNTEWAVVERRVDEEVGPDLSPAEKMLNQMLPEPDNWDLSGKPREYTIRSEKTQASVIKNESVKTNHNFTEMLALEITEQNYAIAAALLPQGFTTIPIKDVIGYFVVLNERKVRVNVETGLVESVGIGNLVVHPDIFHDVYIAVDFAYGDFLKCRKDRV